ncbi:MFS transporter [Lentzea cavernae]|uniref:MFS transporter n=1 Tax=Lentzea cavernae TaxID=2020703 RepID=A0ABQ3MHR2_9PSEU|nr:MFS transporter [Lentzea cavernae]
MIIGIAQLMVVLDSTVVNIALPSAQAELGFSDGNRQWVITAYALSFAALLLLAGRLADLFGRKPAFLLGAAGFAAASVLGGMATSLSVLITARVLQGVFAALLAPATLSLLNTTFTDPRERAKAFGIFGGIGASGTVVGLLVGGTLTEVLDWRWTMYVNVLFCVVALVGGWKLLGNTRDAVNSALDLPGTVLISAGLFAVVYGLSNAESHSWSSPLTWGIFTSGVLLVAAFTWWQTRAKHPLLPLRILTDRNRAASFTTLLLTGAGLFGVLLFLTYYLQLDLGFSPVETGLAFLPMIVVMMVMAQVATMKLVPRLGPRVVLPAGFLLAAAGLIGLTNISLTSGYVTDVLPPLLLFGAGLGTVVPASMSLATTGVDAADAGVASAAVNAVQQVGGSIGTALLNTLAASAAAAYLAGKDPSDTTARASAAITSYTTAFWWSAGIFAAGAVITALLHRRHAAPTSRQAAPSPS